MEIRQLKSVNDNLSRFDHLAKKDSFIEITEWANGEGYDITIDDKMFSLTLGQLDAINYLVLTLQYTK